MILPQLLCASFPVSILPTSLVSIQSSTTFLFSRVIAIYSPAPRDWQLLCVFTLAFPASLLMSACSTFCFLLYFFHLHLSLFDLQLSSASAPLCQLRNSWSLRRGRHCYVDVFRNSKRVEVQHVLVKSSKLKQKQGPQQSNSSIVMSSSILQLENSF